MFLSEAVKCAETLSISCRSHRRMFSMNVHVACEQGSVVSEGLGSVCEPRPGLFSACRQTDDRCVTAVKQSELQTGTRTETDFNSAQKEHSQKHSLYSH